MSLNLAQNKRNISVFICNWKILTKNIFDISLEKLQK